MNAIVFNDKNVVAFTNLPDPSPAPDAVAIDVKASGICHTDYEVLKDNCGTGAFPAVPRHEYAGVVVEVGSDVEGVATGDRIAVDPNIACGTCRACKRGWVHLCENLGAHGVTAHGGFARLRRVKASRLHPIGQMSFGRAALAGPIGFVLNRVDAVFAPWMPEALIFGAWPMGLLMGLALKSRGVSDVAFCDISESRLELVAGFGLKGVAS